MWHSEELHPVQRTAPAQLWLIRARHLILLGGWPTGYAWAFGGGVEYWVTDSVAIRTGADYMRTAFYDSSLVVRGQSNLKTTASVVYYFGMRSRRRL